MDNPENDIKKIVISKLFEHDILVTEDIIKRINHLPFISDTELINSIKENVLLLLDDVFFERVVQTREAYNKKEVEDEKEAEAERLNSLQKNDDSIEVKEKEQIERGTVTVVESFDLEPKKRNVRDFVRLFNRRYNGILRILQGRQELQGLTSISRLKSKGENESVAIVGMIFEKSITKNGNVIIDLEDDTGSTKVVITQKSPSFELAKDLVYDEVIGITGTTGTGIIFANNIIIPDIPLTKELKKSPLDEYALFISDLHFGSTYFLRKEWEKFTKWFHGEIGSEAHKTIVKKIKYLFIVGDVVEGVGIYPGQDKDLRIEDIYDQYKSFTAFLKTLPKHIQIIISPGNHDAVRVAEPQPAIPKKLLPDVYEMENVTMVSNPATVNIGKTDTFSGLDVLLYHGYSLIYYADAVPSIRDAGGLDRTDLIMKFLLQRRHLSPSYMSNQFVPLSDADPLLIKKIPDVLATGHIHMVTASMYRNINLINSSSWIGMTDFQEKMGLHPNPGRAVLLSLKTRNMKILNFNEKEEEPNHPENAQEK